MSFLSDFFSKKEGSVLGVDIGSSSLKVVQLRKERDQAILETYGELALGPYSGGEVGQAKTAVLGGVQDRISHHFSWVVPS